MRLKYETMTHLFNTTIFLNWNIEDDASIFKVKQITVKVLGFSFIGKKQQQFISEGVET